MTPQVEIIGREVECENGCCTYFQFDLFVDGVIQPGWRDTLEDALDAAAKVPGVDVIGVTMMEGYH